jgi:hypothetical protein
MNAAFRSRLVVEPTQPGAEPCQQPKRRTSCDSIGRAESRCDLRSRAHRGRHKLKYFLLEPVQHAGSRSAGVKGPCPWGGGSQASVRDDSAIALSCASCSLQIRLPFTASAITRQRFCTVNVVMTAGKVSALNYTGPTGGLLTSGEQLIQEG